jgi:uncharacterized protein
MNASLRWPGLADMLAFFKTPRTNLSRSLSLQWVLWRSQPLHAYFEQHLQQQAWARSLFDGRPAGMCTLLKSYVDKRIGLLLRFGTVAHDVRVASQALGPTFREAVAHGCRITLMRFDDELQLDLGANGKSMQEGLWSLVLRQGRDGAPISQIYFGFLPGRRMVIGGVQGPRPDQQDAMEGIRVATKVLEGLRPPYFLLMVAQYLALRTQTTLMGVDLSFKARYNPRRAARNHKAYHFDYQAFWIAHEGQRTDDGYWQLAAQPEVRPPEEAPARKRAMYRRRAELVASIPQHLRNVLGPIGGIVHETAPYADPRFTPNITALTTGHPRPAHR